MQEKGQSAEVTVTCIIFTAHNNLSGQLKSRLVEQRENICLEDEDEVAATSV